MMRQLLMCFTRLKWLIISRGWRMCLMAGLFVAIFKVRKEQMPVNYFPKACKNVNYLQFFSFWFLPLLSPLFNSNSLVLPLLSPLFNSNSLVLVFPWAWVPYLLVIRFDGPFTDPFFLFFSFFFFPFISSVGARSHLNWLSLVRTKIMLTLDMPKI